MMVTFAAAKALGASEAEMATLMDSYTANASLVTSEMGLRDASMMSYVLDDSELASARKAVLQNDRALFVS